MKAHATQPTGASTWAPAGPSPRGTFAVRPFVAAAPRATPPPPLDFAGHPLRAPLSTLPPLFPAQHHARQAAATAVQTPGVPLPFEDRIRNTFGRFDVQGVEAHLGSRATASADSIGARAFAAGEHVVFAGRPDLATVAHEATHVLQQRAGLKPAGGVDRPGDPYERQADAVAAAVAAGRTAEPLLHRFIGPWDAKRVLPRPADAAPAVQRVTDEKKLEAALQKLVGPPATLEQFRKWLVIDTGFAWSAIDDDYAAERLADFKTALGRRVDLSLEQEVESKDITARRSNHSKILFAFLQNTFSFAAGEQLVPIGRRPTSLNNLPPAALVPLLQNGDQYYEEKVQGVPVQTIVFRNGNRPGDSLAFFGKDAKIDPQELGKELLLRYHVLFDEAEPRSGEARAAANEEKGAERKPAKKEAEYAPAAYAVGPPRGTSSHQLASSVLTIEMGADQIKNTLVHKGPWTKGRRTPGQAAVMGGQNAKNYVIDQLQPGLDDKQKEDYRAAMGGRYEWLHVIASSLGGLNVLGNLVAGSYDANTKMIALEHRVALWSTRDYQANANQALAADAKSDAKGDAKAAPIAINNATPLTIVGTADVVHDTFIANTINLAVTYKGTRLASGEYKANDQTVITKLQYAAEEKRVEDEIAAARAPAVASPPAGS